MVRLAFDENFNNDVVRGLLRRNPALDIVRVQDSGLRGKDDRAVLAWSARTKRVLVTHDVSTLTAFVYERLRAGQPIAGLIEVGPDVTIATAIEDLLLIAECGEPSEFELRIIYLPLR